MKTKVIFRTFRAGGDTIALFPELPHDTYGHHCVSYAHVGQHGSADPRLATWTRPATPEEIAPLARELESIGYVLEPRLKVTAAMDAERREAARRSRLVATV